ncbi:hypothetical protein BRC85_08300 [Halobacteriales archaeon QS_1_69_70]|nr:MAG: hypothetical protein BRC85_08300 [Halobacteriales archaeon QS_1_69_70]
MVPDVFDKLFVGLLFLAIGVVYTVYPPWFDRFVRWVKSVDIDKEPDEFELSDGAVALIRYGGFILACIGGVVTLVQVGRLLS